jgi:hypothetical protein
MLDMDENFLDLQNIYHYWQGRIDSYKITNWKNSKDALAFCEKKKEETKQNLLKMCPTFFDEVKDD